MRQHGLKALNGCHLDVEHRTDAAGKSTVPVQPASVNGYEPVLTKYAFTPGGNTLEHYLQHQQGYQGLARRRWR